MAKCFECNKRVRLNHGDPTCRDCGVAVHNECAEWLLGCIPFCSECWSNIEWQECPDCGRDTLARYASGYCCEYCKESYGY
jgi:hypothetical protein